MPLISNGAENDAQNIYRKYTRDFVFPGGTAQDGGIRKHDSIFFSGKYDEPTYLTFRVKFDFDCDEDYAFAAIHNGYQQYNEMPHPLFNVIMKDIRGDNSSDEDEEEEEEFSTGSMDDNFASRLNYNEHIFNGESRSTYENIYSTYNYLRYSLGEADRASMLLHLKAGLYDIQENFPYYIKSIDGLSNLMKVDPKKGVRIPEDLNTLTFKCEEALDMRITQILSLYRKIVWDDTYQRWVLPDMMRFFKMTIYVYEMRLFHDVKGSDNGIGSPLSATGLSGNIPGVNSAMSVIGNITASDDFTLVSSAINEMLPTICIECRQCTFDIEDTMEHIGSLYSSKAESGSIEPTIKIHVGNIVETHTYPLSVESDSANSVNKAKETGELHYKYSDNELSMSATRGTARSAADYKRAKKFSVNTTLESTTTTLNRLGYDASEDEYTKSRSIGLEMTENVLTGMFDSMVDWDANEIINMNRGGVMSQATNYSVVSSPLRNLVHNALGGITTMATQAIHQGIDKLMSLPVGNGYVLGDIWYSVATGDAGYLFSMIRDAIHGSTAYIDYVNEYGPEAGRHLSGDMIRIILHNAVLSSATSGVTPFVKLALQIENNPSIATDATNAIADVYNTYMKGLSNEAIDDIDNGYTNPGLVNPQYTSTAIDNKVVDPIPSGNKGTSNEVIDDKDNGYTDPGLVQSPYISSANSTKPNSVGITAYTGTSNEVIDDNDNGYTDPGLVNPGYVSTANAIPVVDPIPPVNRGLSNEVIDDLDNGYTDPGMVNPQYISTANSIPVVDQIPPENRGGSNEVIDDTDNGYTDPGLTNPPYMSTANTIKPVDMTPPENRGLSNEVIDDLDNGYNDPGMNNPPYKSTANTLNPVDPIPPQNRGLSNEAIDDLDNGYNDPGMNNPPYMSTANELDPVDQIPPKNRGLSNEVIDDLDNGYKDPRYKKTPIQSTATSRNTIQWRGIQINTSKEE